MKKHDHEARGRHKFLRKAGWINFHHNVSHSKGGKTNKHNLIRLDAYKHDAYHLIFGNRSLEEAAELLLRLHSLKELQRFNPNEE